MNRRQIFQDILNHKQTGYVLLDLCGCPLSGLSEEAQDALFNHLGYTGERAQKREKLLEYLDIDMRGVGDIIRPEKSVYKRLGDTAYIDEWGVERRFTGLYWDIVNSPLADATLEDLETYPWPDPETINPRLLVTYVDQARHLHEETDYIVCASHPVYGIFELGCWMCGFEEFMVRMMIDKPFVHRFFEIILKYQKRIIQQYYPPLAPYIDYTSSGDDFATQSNLFISPDMFAGLVAPYFKERITYTKQFTNAAYLHHSCGNVMRLIPQLIACGVQILNPIQPTGEDMQPHKLKASFGDSITFHGGLDTQSELPNGTQESVKAAVDKLLDSIQAKNGGYIFAAAHNIQGDVPPENIIAMFKAARNWQIKS